MFDFIARLLYGLAPACAPGQDGAAVRTMLLRLKKAGTRSSERLDAQANLVTRMRSREIYVACQPAEARLAEREPTLMEKVQKLRTLSAGQGERSHPSLEPAGARDTSGRRGF